MPNPLTVMFRHSRTSFLNSISLGVLSLLLTSICAVPAQAARLALVIGNDAYSQIEPLKNARNDAQLLAGLLRKASFDVTLVSNLGREALWGALDTFRGRIQKGDEVVFFFAGHGVQIGANQLLLPVDIAARNDAQVQRDGVPLLDVQDALKDARVAVFIVDACRDNPFPKTGTRAIGGTRGLTPPEPSTGQIIILSAGRNQKALDRVPGDTGKNNGLFTWELSQSLATPGLEIRSALEQVKERVDDKARRVGHEQRPSLVNDLRGSFYLFAAGAGPDVRVPSSRPEPLARTARPGQTEELFLEDLETEEAARLQRAGWQKRMKAEFDKVAAFRAGPDLQVKAWERFLSVWAEGNPLGREDENLRAQAQQRLARAKRQIPSPASLSTIAATLPAVRAGQVVRDCDVCPELVVVPAGSFLMGSPDDEPGRSSYEGPQRQVSVGSFLLGRTEVTQGQWKALMGTNLSTFQDCGEDCPVDNVSWNEAQDYVKKLSERTGKQYRLPSEAEWEYACRGGAATLSYCGGNDVNVVGWYGAYASPVGNSSTTTNRVGQKLPNAYGLYDMSGNVAEWVQDVWHPSYAGAPNDGSAWIVDGDQTQRVARGGHWSGYPQWLRPAFRNGQRAGYRSFSTGFRLARNL